MTILEGVIMVGALFIAAIAIAGAYWYLLERCVRSSHPVVFALPRLGLLGICLAFALLQWKNGVGAIGTLQGHLYLAALVLTIAVSGAAWLVVASARADGRLLYWLNTLLLGLSAGIGLGTVDWSASVADMVTYLIPLLILLSVYLQLLQPLFGDGTGSVGIVERLRKLESMQQARR